MNAIGCSRRFSSRTALAALGLVLAASLAACGSEDDATTTTNAASPAPSAGSDAPRDTDAPTSDSAATTGTVDQTDSTGSSEPEPGDSTLGTGPDIDPSAVGTVELVEPGAEPRSELRLALVEGSTSTFVMTVSLAFDMTFDGDPLPATSIPSMALTGELVVIEVDDDGTATYNFTFSELEALEGSADADTIDAMQPILDEMEGVIGRATVDARGQTLSADIDTAAIDDPTVRAQLEQFVGQVESLAVPFPKEPVGLGGRWTSTRQATLNGITTIVETEYHLTELTAEGYEFELVQQQSAEAGPVELPGLPAGAVAEMRSTDIRGSGTVTGRFDEVIPASEIESSGDVLMFLELGSQSGDVVQHLDLVLTVERG